MKKRFLADISLLVVVIIWGYTFVAIKESLSFISPANFIFLRFAISSFLLLVIFSFKLKGLTFKTVKSGFIAGFFLFLAYLFQTIGLQFTTASNGGFITGFSVILVPLFSSVIFKTPPSRENIIGAIFAFIGLIFISFKGLSAINIGDFMVFICAIAVAFHILFVGIYSRYNDSALLTVIQILTVTIFSLVFVPFSGDFTIPHRSDVWFAIVFCAFFATVVAYLIQTSMQKFTSSSHTALIFSGEPVFAGIFGYFFLGETFDLLQIVGCLLILSGMLISELKIADTL